VGRGGENEIEMMKGANSGKETDTVGERNSTGGREREMAVG